MQRYCRTHIIAGIYEYSGGNGFNAEYGYSAPVCQLRTDQLGQFIYGDRRSPECWTADYKNTLSRKDS